jgi:predicted 3-demethylubiquinone-9 3-methyltransferase (glyoxalase superfamily)
MFDNQASDAVAFYQSVFQNTELLEQTPAAISLAIEGTKFTFLNGGNHHQPGPAVSYFVYCGSDEEIERLYKVLSENGMIMMPLGKYEWTSKYAFITDRFGVAWQLDIDPIRSTQKIVPTLLFSDAKMLQVKSAIEFYSSVFPKPRILLEAPYPADAQLPENTLLFAQFKIHDFIFNATSNNRGDKIDFTPGNSFIIECETQEEINHYWEKLGKNGRYDTGGWLVDQYGVSWRIIPATLSQRNGLQM